MAIFAPSASRLVSLISFIALSGCSQEPSATIAKWELTRAKDRKSYLVKGVVAIDNPSEEGFFHPLLNLVFEDGFQRLNENLDTITADGAIQKPISYKLETPRKIASAVISVRYDEDIAGPSHTVFSEERVVDASLNPPDFPKKPCSPSQREQNTAELSENLEDPDITVENTSREEIVATAINTAGFLCGRVRNMYPSSGSIIVDCSEYRNGRGRAKYRIDTGSMQVEKMS